MSRWLACSISNHGTVIHRVLSKSWWEDIQHFRKAIPELVLTWKTPDKETVHGQTEKADEKMLLDWQECCTALANNNIHVDTLEISVNGQRMCLTMVEMLSTALVTNQTVHQLKLTTQSYGFTKPEQQLVAITTSLCSMLCKRQSALSLDIRSFDVRYWTDTAFALQNMNCLHRQTIHLSQLPIAWHVEPDTPPCDLFRITATPPFLSVDENKQFAQFLDHHHIHIVQWSESGAHAMNGHLEMTSTNEHVCGWNKPSLQAFYYHIVNSMTTILWPKQLDTYKWQFPSLLKYIQHAPNLRMLLETWPAEELLPALDGKNWPHLQTLALEVMPDAMQVSTFDRELRRVLASYKELTHIVLLFSNNPTFLNDNKHMKLAEVRKIRNQYATVLANALASSSSAVCTLSILDSQKNRATATIQFVDHILSHPQCKIQHLWAPDWYFDSKNWQSLQSRANTNNLGHSLQSITIHDTHDCENTCGVYETVAQLPQLLAMTVRQPSRNASDHLHACIFATYDLSYRQTRFVLQRDAWQQTAVFWLWKCALDQEHPLLAAILAWLPTLRAMTAGVRARPWELYVPDLAYQGIEWMDRPLTDHQWSWTTTMDELQFWADQPLFPASLFCETLYIK